MNLYNPGKTNTQCIRCKTNNVTEGNLCPECLKLLTPFDFEELKNRLEKFDRTYSMSDDHRVWSKWKQEEKALDELINQAVDFDREKTLLIVDETNNAQKWGTKFSIDKKPIEVYNNE